MFNNFGALFGQYPGAVGVDTVVFIKVSPKHFQDQPGLRRVCLIRRHRWFGPRWNNIISHVWGCTPANGRGSKAFLRRSRWSKPWTHRASPQNHPGQLRRRRGGKPHPALFHPDPRLFRSLVLQLFNHIVLNFQLIDCIFVGLVWPTNVGISPPPLQNFPAASSFQVLVLTLERNDDGVVTPKSVARAPTRCIVFPRSFCATQRSPPAVFHLTHHHTTVVGMIVPIELMNVIILACQTNDFSFVGLVQ